MGTSTIKCCRETVLSGNSVCPPPTGITINITFFGVKGVPKAGAGQRLDVSFGPLPVSDSDIFLGGRI